MIVPSTQLLFPIVPQSISTPTSPQPANLGAAQNQNTLNFSQVMKTLAPDSSAPTETAKYTRSAKATEVREWVLKEAAADPAKAEMWAHLYAYNSLNGPLEDITDLPIVRLSTTGEIYTQEMQTYYAQVRNAMQGDRSALYESEMAKSTPAIKILEKIFAYNDELPEEFKRLADW
jgi:hypothetical protein